MAKSSKKSKEPVASADTTENAPSNVADAGKPARSVKSSTSLGAKTPARRTTAASTPRKSRASASKGKTAGAHLVAIPDDDIRMRAYFLSEQRAQSGAPGDSAHDWIEARRQLQEEAKKNA